MHVGRSAYAFDLEFPVGVGGEFAAYSNYGILVLASASPMPLEEFLPLYAQFA
jgi:hypothetical protein